MTRLGTRLLKAAQEARAIAKGDASPDTFRVHVPENVDVAGLRSQLHMTREQFAQAFGLPLGTVRDWEQGRRSPDTSARAYLRVIEKDPEAVKRALAA